MPLYAAGSRADVKSGALLPLMLFGFLFRDRAPEALADNLNVCIAHETDVSRLTRRDATRYDLWNTTVIEGSLVAMSIARFSKSNLPFLAVLALAACKEDEVSNTSNQIRPVLSVVVVDVEGSRGATYPGRAQVVRELSIAFEVSGKVLSRPADVGKVVEEGDSLAALDADPYLARVLSLEGQRAAHLATLENAEIELERREQLVKNEFVAQAQVENQIALVKVSEANLEATKGSLGAARLDLGYTTLEAPFDGTVSATFIERFRNVASGQRILRILETSRIEMEISVPENLIVLEPYVDSIVVSTLPGVKIPTQIARVGTEASSSTRTDPVTIVMEQPEEGEIQLGMAGNPTIEIALPDGIEETGIQIPASAVFSQNTASSDEKFVWVIDPETSTVSASAVEVKAFGDRGLLVSGHEPRARLFNAGANTLIDAQEAHVSEDGS